MYSQNRVCFALESTSELSLRIVHMAFHVQNIDAERTGFSSYKYGDFLWDLAFCVLRVYGDFLWVREYLAFCVLRVFCVYLASLDFFRRSVGGTAFLLLCFFVGGTRVLGNSKK